MRAAEAPRPAGPKRLTAAIQVDPPTLSYNFNPSGAGAPGLDSLELLINSGLSMADDLGRSQPVLVEQVPSLENGLWRLGPDGTMETTWQIKPNARWHDGTPFTAQDLIFTATVEQDKALDVRPKRGYESVESITAPDARTLVARWRRPFIDAAQLFDTPPMPKHILERAYAEGKEALGAHPHWTTDYVGTGAFRLRQFVPGSHTVLEANDTYTLGRPKIDELEVKFIPDPNTLAANLLAGAVELTLGRNLSLDQAVQVRDQWRDGRMELLYSGWLVVFPQFINPNPSVIGDLRFRRALLHAIDRQQMADTLMLGLVPVAHTFLSPSDPQYRMIEPEIVKYDHDLRRSAELLNGLGYARGADGGFRDAAGHRLNVEIRVSAGRDLNMKTVFAIADFWNQLGIAAEPIVIPAQRARDREYVQTFPGFLLYNQPTEVSSIARHHSSQTPLPENNFNGNNNSRYMNPEFDTAIDRYFSTIPTAERTRALGQVIRHMTENLNMMGMFYNAVPTMISRRLTGTAERKSEIASQIWNVHLWDVN